MHASALLLLWVFQFVRTQECLFPHRTLEEAWEEQLIEDLRDKHGSKSPPNDTVTLYFHFFLKYFSIDETTFTAYSWLLLSWNDQRLKWDPSDYKGVSEVVYKNYKFWEPSFQMLNEVDDNDFEYQIGQCRLDKDGGVTYVPRVLHQAPCHTKLSNWPFDTQNCTLQMGFFTPNANIEMEKFEKVATLMGAEYGSDWTILKVYQEYKDMANPITTCNKAKQLHLTFFIEREGAGLGAIVVVPSILLTVLALSSFLMSVQDKIRLGVLSFNLLCHFLLITDLSKLIPEHSEDSPTILFYLRGSVFINMLLIMFTLFLMHLRNKTDSVPVRIVTVNDTVLKSKVNFVIWPRWKVDIPKKASEDEQLVITQWADFSNILNSFCFWLVVIVYVCFICLYIPRPCGFDAEDSETISLLETVD